MTINSIIKDEGKRLQHFLHVIGPNLTSVGLGRDKLIVYSSKSYDKVRFKYWEGIPVMWINKKTSTRD